MIKYVLVLVYTMSNGTGIKIETTDPIPKSECVLAYKIINSDYDKMIEAQLKGGVAIEEKYLIASKCAEINQ